MTDYKEKSVTKSIKTLMKHSKKIRKITTYYDMEDEKIYYNIYLKRGYVHNYDIEEIDFTSVDVEEKEPGRIAAALDDWLDEIVMSNIVLKEYIDGIKDGIYKPIRWLDD